MTSLSIEEFALEDQLDALRSREAFLPYYMRMTGFFPPKHVRLIARLCQAMEDDLIDRAMVFAPPRHAKRCADSTPILTANRGWITHGALVAGDMVFHPSGKAVRVLEVYAPDVSDQVVTFSNGENIKCDRGHLWTVCDQSHRRRDLHRGQKEWLTITTEEIRKRGLHIGGEAGKRGSRLRWHLPDCLGLDGEWIDRAMGPYSLGAWLGDGSVGKPRLTMCSTDIEPVVAAMTAEGYAERKRYIHKTTGVHSAVFTEAKGKPRAQKAPLCAHLEREGVLFDKHVPDRWMTASRGQRLEILAGLMDTDGHCEANTGRCRIVTSMPRLAHSIHDLCASLGFRPYITTFQPDGTETRGGITSKQPTFTIGFQPHEAIPCRLDRKRPVIFQTRRAISITTIEDGEPESARCITVDADDGLYLVGRKMVPTHNTLLCTTLFPSWLMGRDPSVKLMSVVHTQKYAGKIGRNVRNMLLKPQWPFPDVRLSGDSTAREQWAVPQGGEYNGFGAIGGNQHGNPADWLLMDDLVKGRKIAMSPHMRQEVWETYKTDLLSRLQGRAKQLMVFTRWHQDDPAGRILPDDYDGRTGWYADKETGEKWYVLSLPAVAEHDDDPLGRAPGEWLWPEHFGESKLGGQRKRGGWMWSALYQQRPSPEEGLMFTEDHITRFDPQKIDLTQMQVYGASDYAVTEEGGSPNPDWTVHQVWAVDSEFNLFLMDMWRGRTLPDEWVRQWARLVLKWKPLRWFEESGQIIKAVGPLITTIQREQNAFVNRVQMTSTVDKPSRAQTLLGLASLGKVYLPHRHMVSAAMLPHLEAFENELKTFPSGTKDDTVDAATLMARGIDRVVAGSKPKKQRSPHGDTLDDLWQRQEELERRRDR